MFASSRYLHLELLCTRGTPVSVKKNLGHLPAFPIVISYANGYNNIQGDDRDNLFAALEHRDRVRAVEVYVPDSMMLGELAMAMQEPFTALVHLRLLIQQREFALPDTFLSGSAPCLQTISISGITFPAVPALLSSAHDLVSVDLSDIPPTGYIPPATMVASLATLHRLKYLTIGFESGMSYPDRMRLSPITLTVLPALTKFYFDGLSEYFEDLLAQIDAPQLGSLHIEYLAQGLTNYQIPQLCKFIDRLAKFKLFRANLYTQPNPDIVIITLDMDRGYEPVFHLSVQEDAMDQVVNQISVMLSNVDRLFIGPIANQCGYVLSVGIRWLELLHPFTSVKVLSVGDVLSSDVSLALNSLPEERAAKILPALELLYLEDEPVTSVKKFVAARQNLGRPVTVFNEEPGFREIFHTLYARN